RNCARRSQGRSSGRRQRRRRLRGLQGHRLACALGRCRAAKRHVAQMMTAVIKGYVTAAAAGALLLVASVGASAQDAKPELSRVRLAVGGKPALFYLPLTVTERLGYFFRDAGLDVEISDFPGGARALQALIGGSADVVTGAYDHTIQMQAKGQPIV